MNKSINTPHVGEAVASSRIREHVYALNVWATPMLRIQCMGTT